MKQDIFFWTYAWKKTYVMYCQQSVSDKNIISTYSNTIFIDTRINPALNIAITYYMYKVHVQ